MMSFPDLYSHQKQNQLRAKVGLKVKSAEVFPQGHAADCWQRWCLLNFRLMLCLQMYSTVTSERDNKAAVVKSLREFEHRLYQFASCLLIPLKTNGEESKQSIRQGGHWLLRHAVVQSSSQQSHQPRVWGDFCCYACRRFCWDGAEGWNQ